MNKKHVIFRTYIVLFLLLFVQSVVKAQITQVLKTSDTTKITKYNDTINLKYPFRSNQSGSLYLTDPSKSEIIYDVELGKYMIVEKIGDYYVKYPIFMSQEAYKKYKLKKDMFE